MLEQSIVELEAEMTLLQGLEKKCVLNLISYYEFQSRHIAGFELNPATKKSMEIVHY